MLIPLSTKVEEPMGCNAKEWRERLPKASLHRHRATPRRGSSLEAPARIDLHTGKDAPTFLIPSLFGYALRSFMIAKTVGDIDHGAKEVHRVTGKERGVLMQTVHKRLGKTPVAEPSQKPKG